MICPMLTSVFAPNCWRYIVDSASRQIVAYDLEEPNDLPLLHLVLVHFQASHTSETMTGGG
jgi:hypothetical protein